MCNLNVITVLLLRIVLSLLVLEPVSAYLDESLVVASVGVDALCVQMQDVRHYGVEELSVVRHDKDRRHPRLTQPIEREREIYNQ